VLAIIRDITARKRTEAHIHRLAYFDVLTGSAEPRMARRLSVAVVVEARREHRGVAVLYIDLDQFKRINDTLGHQTGDALLTDGHRRLNSLAVPRGDEMSTSSSRALAATSSSRAHRQCDDGSRRACCQAHPGCAGRAVPARWLRVRRDVEHRHRVVPEHGNDGRVC
jgi:hypothetical protein